MMINEPTEIIINEGDWYDGNGNLHCGRCKELRLIIHEVLGEKVKQRRFCKCEKLSDYELRKLYES